MKYRTRKVFEIGDSYAISMPPDWLRSHKKLQEVVVLYDLGGLLLVIPVEESKEHTKMLKSLNRQFKKRIEILEKKK